MKPRLLLSMILLGVMLGMALTDTQPAPTACYTKDALLWTPIAGMGIMAMLGVLGLYVVRWQMKRGALDK